MRRSRYWVVEGVVVLALLAVLVVVSLPRFFDSQVSLKVAQAQRDLHSMIQSMETYYLDYNEIIGANGLLGMSVRRDWLDPEQRSVEGITIEPVKREMRIKTIHLPAETLSAYFETVPVPQLPMEIEGTPNPQWRPGYITARWRLRNEMKDRQRANLMPGVEDGLFWHHFFKDYHNAGYLGVAEGPLLHHDIGKPGKLFGLDGHTHFQTYDPSNGLVSHGYIVVDTPPEPNQKVVDFPEPPPPSTEWEDRPRALSASTTLPATSVEINGVEDLLAYHKNLFSTLAVTFYGEEHSGSGAHDPFVLEHLYRQYRVQAVAGNERDRFTSNDVDDFYFYNNYNSTYPVEFTFAYDGEDRWAGYGKVPRNRRMPGASSFGYVANGPNFYRVNLDENTAHLVKGKMDKREKSSTLFDPLPFITPFNSITSTKLITMEKNGETTYRIRWEKPLYQGYNDPFYTMDAVIDSTKGYLPVRVHFTGPDPFEQVIFGGPPVTRVDEWYVELEDYRVIDGVYFPTTITVMNWLLEIKGTLDLAAIKKEAAVFRFPQPPEEETPARRKKELRLQAESVRINQPMEYSDFWLRPPEDFKYLYGNN